MPPCGFQTKSGADCQRESVCVLRNTRSKTRVRACRTHRDGLLRPGKIAPEWVLFTEYDTRKLEQGAVSKMQDGETRIFLSSDGMIAVAPDAGRFARPAAWIPAHDTMTLAEAVAISHVLGAARWNGDIQGVMYTPLCDQDDEQVRAIYETLPPEIFPAPRKLLARFMADAHYALRALRNMPDHDELMAKLEEKING